MRILTRERLKPDHHLIRMIHVDSFWPCLSKQAVVNKTTKQKPLRAMPCLPVSSVTARRSEGCDVVLTCSQLPCDEDKWGTTTLILQCGKWADEKMLMYSVCVTRTYHKSPGISNQSQQDSRRSALVSLFFLNLTQIALRSMCHALIHILMMQPCHPHNTLWLQFFQRPLDSKKIHTFLERLWFRKKS